MLQCVAGHSMPVSTTLLHLNMESLEGLAVLTYAGAALPMLLPALKGTADAGCCSSARLLMAATAST
jgi:hypothetical protein